MPGIPESAFPISCSWALANRSTILINVMDFLSIISSPNGVNIGMRNISLSTCGLVPMIYKLARTASWPDAFGLAARAHG